MKETSTDRYLYYGNYYDIEVVDGKGVDVIGYRGSNTNKKKLLGFYNTNPDLDVQSGKYFRQKTKDESDIEQYFLFEKDGQRFYMNEKQREANDRLQEFYNSEQGKPMESYENVFMKFEGLGKPFSGMIPKVIWDRSFGIVGRGGTGKTTTVKQIMTNIFGRFDSGGILYVAPTHNAVTELQEALGYDSEKTEGVKTVASFLAREVPKGDSERGVESTDELWLLKPDILEGLYEQGFRKPITSYSMIVLDESSFMGKKFMEDLIRMIRIEKEFFGNVKIPMFVFMGDFRQLPPVGENEEEGLISATLFNTPEKMVELKEVMRTKSQYFHNIFDSVGLQIEERRRAINAGETPKDFDFDPYDSITKESSEDLLILGDKQIDEAIGIYTDELIGDSDPYNIMWIHYNKIDKDKTKELSKRMRKAYFEKMKIPFVEEVTSKDYVQAKITVPMYTSNLPEFNINQGVLKPKARVKIKEVFDYEVDMGEIHNIFKGYKIPAKIYTFINRQGRERAVSVPIANAVKIGKYDVINKTKPVTLETTSGTVTLDVKYSILKGINQELLSLTKSIENIFEFSYVVSSHSIQGSGFRKVIVGDYNLRQNYPHIGQRDATSSLYTMLTRVKEKLIIVKPSSKLVYDPKNFSLKVQDLTTNVSPELEDKETDICNFEDTGEVPF